jgi:hypothetical protein
VTGSVASASSSLSRPLSIKPWMRGVLSTENRSPWVTSSNERVAMTWILSLSGTTGVCSVVVVSSSFLAIS